MEKGAKDRTSSCRIITAVITTNGKSTKELLVGTWECIVARESQQNMGSMKDMVGLVWEFDPEGTITATNAGKTTIGTYSVVGDSLKLNEEDKVLVLTLKKLTDESLVAETMMEGYSFHLEFARKE